MNNELILQKALDSIKDCISVVNNNQNDIIMTLAKTKKELQNLIDEAKNQ